MNEKIASLSFFSALVNQKKNIIEVLSELVAYALLSEKIRLFIIPDATVIVNKFYSFDLPDAVVKKACIKLHKNGALQKNKDASYSFINESKIDVEGANRVFEVLQETHNKICTALFRYTEEKFGRIFIAQYEINNLIKCLFEVALYGKTENTDHYNIISSFLLSIESNEEYTSYLNDIRPALVIYQGICHTQNLNDLGLWKNELCLFLNTMESTRKNSLTIFIS